MSRMKNNGSSRFSRGNQRVNYQQQIDRYTALGQDALTSGDRVAAENFFQHAEHFFRIQSERMQQRVQKQPQQEENDNESRETDTKSPRYSSKKSDGNTQAQTPATDTTSSAEESFE